MAVPVHQSHGLLAVTSGLTTAAVPVPSGVSSGHLIVVQLYKENTAAVTPPAGFTQKSQTSTTDNVQHTVFYKWTTGDDTGTYDFTWTGATFAGGSAHRITGAVGSGDPFDAFQHTAAGSAGTAAPSVSVTTSGDDRLLWYGATGFAGDSVWTPISGGTEIFETANLTADRKDQAAAGSSGSLSAATSSSDLKISFLGAILPGTSAPTLVQYAESSWSGAGATGSITWQAGDVILCLGMTSDNTNGTLTTPSASGLSFSALAGLPTNTGSSCKGYGWVATPGAGGTSTVSSTLSGANGGIAVWVWRGSAGLGTPAADTTTGQTISLSRTGNRSAVCTIVGDWGAGQAPDTPGEWTPTPSNIREGSTQGAEYTVGVADWVDEGASGTTSYGLNVTASGQNYTNVAVEVRGALGGGVDPSFWVPSLSLQGAPLVQWVGAVAAPDIEFVNEGAFASGTTSAAPGVPSSPVSGNLLVLLAGGKPFSSTPTASGYTQQTTGTSGSVANGNGTGSVVATALTKTSDGTETGTVTVSLTSGSPTMARILQFSHGASGATGWDLAGTTLSDTTETGTGVSATGSQIDIAAGDVLVLSAVIKDDAPNHTSQALSVPGCTLGTITWDAKQTTTSGNDGAVYIGYVPVVAGSATDAPTYTATSSVSGASSTAVNVLRLRSTGLPTATMATVLATPGLVGPNRLWQPPRDYEVPEAAGPQTITADQAAETETAQTVTPRRVYATTQTAETETAQAVTVRKTIAVGQAVETEVGQAVGKAKVKAAAQATETEVGQTPTVRKTLAVGQAAEAELGQTVTPKGVIGQAVETEVAQTVAVVKTRAAAQASETETAQAVTVRKTIAVAQTVEAELGQAVNEAKTRTLGQAAETEVGQGVAKLKRAAVAQATETEAAQSVTTTGHKIIPVGQAAETETGQAFAKVKVRVLAQAAETEAAQALGKRLAYSIGQAAETETALAVLTGVHASSPPGRIVVGVTGGAITFPADGNGTIHIDQPAGILTIGE